MIDPSRWSATTVVGAAYRTAAGLSGTLAAPGLHRPQFYSSPGTLIIGADRSDNNGDVRSTSVSWSIPIASKHLMASTAAFLAIGAVRQFAGLHTRTYNAAANVMLNHVSVDRVNLRVQPQGHSDYFHRVPLSAGFPLIEPFNSCSTIYTWNIPKQTWCDESDKQQLDVEIGEDVVWDIDYVGLLYNYPKRVFISYSHADAKIARALHSRITNIGEIAWIDTQELKIGDSLISRLQSAISQVDFVFALISENSVKSRWVERELDAAMNEEINGLKLTVVPIRLDDCELPLFLRGKIYGDLRPPRNYGGLMQQIEALLRDPE